MSSGAAVVSSPSHGSESGYVFLLCDAQDIWNRKVKRSDNGGEEGSLIWHYDTVIHTCRYMVDLGRELSIPLIVSEQYPERFGGTDPRIGVNVGIASLISFAGVDRSLLNIAFLSLSLSFFLSLSLSSSLSLFLPLSLHQSINLSVTHISFSLSLSLCFLVQKKCIESR